MSTFDPHQKEQQLRRESANWDTSTPVPAEDGDIPVLDLASYFTTGDESALNTLADQLRIACEEVGFFSITGHQIPKQQMEHTFTMVRRFHELPADTKRSILMDRPEWPVGGMGYLPVKNRKLPARDKGNLNEAFIIKCDHELGFDDNQWPDDAALPAFRQTVEDYAKTLETLGKRLLPIFARALEMPTDFFAEAFHAPLYRLRMTHYPPLAQAERPADEYGIAPHVDTSFCTILAQDKPGLTIFSERRQQWIQAPLLDNAFVVNAGELLRQWTNDRFLSTKHFANNNTGDTSRYSIPFFLNANSHYTMHCIPSCCGPDNPAKYPPISYAESQGVVQGE
ncbi:MAG: isopenicillin N synthase family dioxygenase [Thiolinea sp.]